MKKELSQIFGLHEYQEELVDFCVRTPKCGLFLQMGLGKTRIALATVCELVITNSMLGHCLVVAPKTIARSSWIDEMNKIEIDIRYQSFLVDEKGKELTKAERELLFEGAKTAPPTMYFISRDLLPQMTEYFGTEWCFPMIIADEYQSFKNPHSKRTKSLMSIMPYTERVIGLTGTPTPNGLDDLWSLIAVLDAGQRLGRTMYEYHQKYFMAWKTIGSKVTKWIPIIGAEQRIYDKISDIVVSLDNSNLTLPPVVYETVRAYMSSGEYQVYTKMVEDSKIFIEDALVRAVNPAVLVSKLVQIASGMVYTNKKGDYLKIHEAKIEQLQYIYDNEPSPLLVAYHYRTDAAAITGRFRDAVVFDGKPETIHAWNEKKIRMLLIQPLSAGAGLNLQEGGHILIWYTLPWSLEEYLQTNSRVFRQGQNHAVSIIHIVCSDTIDERILRILEMKNETQQGLLDAVRHTVGIREQKAAS
jgi:SNF2 family DNA or RNA helicase